MPPNREALRTLPREYSREPHVEAQIRKVMDIDLLPDERLLKRLGAEEREGYLAAETLLYFLRSHVAAGSINQAWQIAELLIEHVIKLLHRRLSNSTFLSPLQRDEVQESAIQQFFERWLSLDERHAFWEARFHFCMERDIRDAVERALRTAHREISLAPKLNEEGYISDAWDNFQDDGIEDPLLRVAMEQILLQLPPQIRTAFLLRKIEEYDEERVSSLLNCTTRTVRNYVRRAESLLQERLMEIPNNGK